MSSLKPRQLFCLWLALACSLIAADQWIKQLILENFYYGDRVYITSFFNLVRAHNTGAAFSMLADAGGWQHWLFSGIAVVVSLVILMMLWRYSTEKLMAFSLTCLLGGAIGNLVDRILHGYVVDYLDFHWGNIHFPAFNLADAAICTGAGLLIIREIYVMIAKKPMKT